MKTATIVGAGVFGAWTAHALKSRGWRVTLVDQHGPANSRASSGGETRIIRSGYGNMSLYTRWAEQSLLEWLNLEIRTQARLFVKTGALFVGNDAGWLADTARTLGDEQVPSQWLDAPELRKRFPQLQFDDGAAAVLETTAGVLFARRAVQALARVLREDGVEVVARRADPQAELLNSQADAVIFAAGAWLPTLFPDVLKDVIFPTRQEVFFFGAPAGVPDYSAPRLPAWVAFDEGIYGIPDVDHRGVKIAVDAHGPIVDPETMDRIVDSHAVTRMRHVLQRRMPGIADAPLLEARVCQYENTADGHFLLDRLPGQDSMWIAGGGSGHGFKHGPAVGRYMADLVEGHRDPDPMFQLSGRPLRRRMVY
jgi:sarcosine oxidase